MNKNQINKALREVESILQRTKEITVVAFVYETEDISRFHVKEVTYYRNGKNQCREFDINADSAKLACEMYHSDYAPKECSDLVVFIYDFGNEE